MFKLKYHMRTLVYLIDVGVRLLNSRQISSHYALIPYPTFIDFEGNRHPIHLFHPIPAQFSFKHTKKFQNL